MERKTQTTRLVETAIMMALAAILSEYAVLALPFGGKVTIMSMLPILLIALKYGVKWGFLVTVLYGVIQGAISFAKVTSWGMPPGETFICLMLDYVLAYAVLGVAGAFGKRSFPWQLTGISLAVALRFCCHFLSGITIFGNWAEEQPAAVIIGSLSYNASFLLPDLVLLLIGASVMLKTPVLKRLMSA